MGNSSTKAKNKYKKTAYRQMNLQLKPELMEVFSKYCKEFSYTKNNFITQAIKEKLERETGKNFDQLAAEMRTTDKVGSSETAEDPSATVGRE